MSIQNFTRGNSNLMNLKILTVLMWGLPTDLSLRYLGGLVILTVRAFSNIGNVLSDEVQVDFRSGGLTLSMVWSD